MKMRTYIELGAKKAGSNKALAKILGQSETILSDVKAEKKGLPVAICMKLADYIEIDRLEIIAASNLVTEKDEERRKILKSCFTKAASVTAATLLLGALSIMSPSPANASPASSSSSTICIMLN